MCVLVLTASAAVASGGTKACVPSKEGKPFLTPKAGVCKAGYTLTELGAEGKEGAQGVTGATGPSGAQGATGQAGALGPQGVTGATGAVGATGATGPEGKLGPEGKQGEQGPSGAAGSSIVARLDLAAPMPSRTWPEQADIVLARWTQQPGETEQLVFGTLTFTTPETAECTEFGTGREQPGQLYQAFLALDGSENLDGREIGRSPELNAGDGTQTRRIEGGGEGEDGPYSLLLEEPNEPTVHTLEILRLQDSCGLDGRGNAGGHFELDSGHIDVIGFR
jgi:hypothetical protein